MLSVNLKIKPLQIQNFRQIQKNEPEKAEFICKNKSNNLQSIKTDNYKANFIPFCSAHVTKVFDAHGHIMDDSRTFKDQGIDRNLTLPIIKSATSELEDGVEVDYVAVSNLEGFVPENQGVGKPRMDFVKANEIMLAKCEEENAKDPSFGPKFLPQAVCDPTCDDPERLEAFENFLNKNQEKICGFKFHPTHSGITPTDVSYQPFIELAAKYKMPCFFHTAGETNNNGEVWPADPKTIAKFAQNLYKKAPDVPVVLYHINLGGWDKFQPLNLVKDLNNEKKANLFLEVSWVEPDLIIKALKMGLEDKILFGTDTPLGPMGNNKGYFARVKEIENAVNDNFPDEKRAQEILDKLFYKNAENIFTTR